MKYNKPPSDLCTQRTYGAPREVFAHPEVIRSAGLELPQPAELVERLAKAGMNIGGTVLSVEECVEALAALLEESPCQS